MVLLKEVLPDAVQLSFDFDTTVSFSPGTMKTTLESAPQGGRVRRHGQLVHVPWGDVSTAFHTTGIPNVTVYVPASLRLGRSDQRERRAAHGAGQNHAHPD